MTTPRFEAFLAGLYVDDDLRQRFVADPRACAQAAGLTQQEIDALVNIDRTGLELAARSYGAKRKSVGSRKHGWLRKVLGV